MSDGRPIDPAAIRRVVAEVIAEVVRESEPSSPAKPSKKSDVPDATEGLEAHKPLRGPSKRPLPPPLRPRAVERIVEANPARLVPGRTGTRYLTEVYVGLRADHAIALDAVHSELPESFADQHGWIPVRTRCKDKEEFLLFPDHGRRLDDESRARIQQHGDKGTDVTIIAGDGLTAWALIQNGPPLVAALLRDLPAAGFKVGRPICARNARIGVADEIGVLLSTKCTVILVGERPGLGTGDSLSIYTAYGPKLGQDNSEKDCISNVRNLGLPPDEASRRTVELLKRTFAAGGGGVHLV
jgi:ethanolamine ammonia-lyase small subunit